MRVPSPMRLAALTLLVGGLACAKNNPDETVGAARDTTTTGISDSANSRQDQSGVTDSSGQSTLGKDVTRTRPDQGQPVTSKGDTINAGVDSAAAQQPSTQVPSDSQAPVSSDSVSPRSDTSMVAPSADSMSMNHGADSSSMNQGGNSSTVNSGVDSATTGAVVDTATPSATSPSTTSTTTDSSTGR